MKYLISIVILTLFIWMCSPTKELNNSLENGTATNDTVRIANDSLEYEIIIIDPGFNSWLAGRARPRNYYSQQFLENRNQIYVINWNQRVLNPTQYDPNLYLMQIDYNPNIDYGYEVNYQLYYYFIYFQLQYKQRLAGFVPRI